MLIRFVCSVGAALLAAGVGRAGSGCGDGWSPIPGRPGPVSSFNTDPALQGVTPGPILAMQVFDEDGPGPVEPYLVAAGSFISMGAAGTSRIARWNGSYWIATITSQIADPVTALVEWDDDGPGPASPELYAFDNNGQAFRWTGVQWAAFGAMNVPLPANPASDPRCDSSIRITAAIAFDDDNDGRDTLFVAACDKVYERTSGGAWQQIGIDFFAPIYALAVHDDGAGFGPRLHAGGAFSVGAGAVANRVAVLSHLAAPQQWFSLPGSGVNNTVYALHSGPDFDAPGRRALYVGGAFTNIVGQGSARLIAKWDGTLWSVVGGGLKGGDSTVRAFADYDPDGPGPEPEVLVVAGGFGQTNDGALNIRRVALWNGAQWSALGAGISAGAIAGEALGVTSPTVRALAPFDSDMGGPGGTQLYAAGYFGEADGLAVNSIAPWTAPITLAIASDPADLKVASGETAVFAVAANADATLTFQWLKNGQPLADAPRISGAESPVLRIADADADDAGQYSCTVSSTGCAAVTSAPAFLTVACAGDANLDGAVDFTDLNTVVSFFNTVCP